ncbi:MAG: OsmC family protein [Verrucomicrobia bacterium]|nr:OsmC family protein [Verrucomicrobiota bacterium]
MDREQLRARQAPLKQKYVADPESAMVTLRAEGTVGENVTCSIATGRALVEAGLHPATGGAGLAACSGDMLLQALVACAGVTLGAVATSLGIEVRGGTLVAEGDLDFRGTLAVAKDVPVGFKQIRLYISLDTDATSAQREKLLALTKGYCVVYQTLLNGADVMVTL